MSSTKHFTFALILSALCGNPVDNILWCLWIKMWKIGQVFLRQCLQSRKVADLLMRATKRSMKISKKKFQIKKFLVWNTVCFNIWDRFFSPKTSRRENIARKFDSYEQALESDLHRYGPYIIHIWISFPSCTNGNVDSRPKGLKPCAERSIQS